MNNFNKVWKANTNSEDFVLIQHVIKNKPALIIKGPNRSFCCFIADKITEHLNGGSWPNWLEDYTRVFSNTDEGFARQILKNEDFTIEAVGPFDDEDKSRIEIRTPQAILAKQRLIDYLDPSNHGLIKDLVAAMLQWGSEEDGIPDFAWDAYSNAVFKLTGTKPDPKND